MKNAYLFLSVLLVSSITFLWCNQNNPTTSVYEQSVPLQKTASINNSQVATGDFNDDFSTGTLDPAWSIADYTPGHGEITLSENPGFLRYKLTGWLSNQEGWRNTVRSGWLPSLAAIRSFSGKEWKLETKVTYNLHERIGSTSRGAQMPNLFIAFGSGNDNYIQIRRYVDYAYNYNGLVVILTNTNGTPASSASSELVAPGDVDANEWLNYTYWYRIERNGDSVNVFISYDGANYISTLSFNLPSSTEDVQRIILDETLWEPVGSYADWDYFKLTNKPSYRLPFEGRRDITVGPNCDKNGTAHVGPSAGAIDFSMKLEDVYASNSGRVAFAGWADGVNFGNLVQIKHNDGNISFYAHLDSISVSKGDSVNKGQIIGVSGRSGNIDFAKCFIQGEADCLREYLKSRADCLRVCNGNLACRKACEEHARNEYDACRKSCIQTCSNMNNMGYHLHFEIRKNTNIRQGRHTGGVSVDLLTLIPDIFITDPNCPIGVDGYAIGSSLP